MSYIVRYIHNPDVYFAAGRASIYGLEILLVFFHFLCLS